jgi:hypothetical protein
MAFSRAARSALLLWPDPDDPEGESGCERILALGKTNIAPRSTRARRYRIETVHLSHIAADPCNGLEQDLEAATTARMTYSGESSMTANQLLRSGKKKDEAMPREPSASVREARDFLLSLEGLGRMGPVGAKDLFEVAAEYGLTQANLRTAARLLNDEAVEADEEPYIVQARRPEFQAGVEWRLARRYSRTRAGDIRTPNQWASVEMSGNQAESSTLSHSSPLIQEEIDLTETAAEEVYEPEIDADEAARIAAEEAHLESIAATGRIVPGLPEPPEATALITASVAGEHDAIPQEQSEFEAREPQWSTESGAAP